MFYVGKSRASALLDTSNPNFMSVVLSDPNTCIGPLWKNTSATYVPVFKTYSTDIFNDEDLRSEGPGELFMYTKNSAAVTQGSPGYVVVDFDITFKTLQVNIRELTFPMNRLKYNQYGMGYNVPVGFTQGNEAVVQTRGALLDGSFSSITSDPAVKLGDVFKLVFVGAAAQYVAVGPSNLFQYGIRQGLESTLGIVGLLLTMDSLVLVFTSMLGQMVLLCFILRLRQQCRNSTHWNGDQHRRSHPSTYLLGLLV
jgi:hypothetical protein